LERRLEGHDQAIKSLFDAIRHLAAPPAHAAKSASTPSTKRL